MHADHAALLRALIDTLDHGPEDGLTASQALLAAHAAQTVADGIETRADLSEPSAIMHSLAEVLGAGDDVSGSLAFLLARAAATVPVLMEDAPAPQVVALHGR